MFYLAPFISSLELNKKHMKHRNWSARRVGNDGITKVEASLRQMLKIRLYRMKILSSSDPGGREETCRVNCECARSYSPPLTNEELAFPCTRQRRGETGGVGGGVKRRGARWGRAHSLESRSCGAPRILLAENPPCLVCGASVLEPLWSGCGKTLQRDKTKNFSPPGC